MNTPTLIECKVAAPAIAEGTSPGPCSAIAASLLTKDGPGGNRKTAAPWVVTMRVLSTAHLAERTMHLLTAVSSGATSVAGITRVATYEEGLFVQMASDAADLPPDLAAVHAWLREHEPEAQWLRFDADGDAVEALDLHAW